MGWTRRWTSTHDRFIREDQAFVEAVCTGQQGLIRSDYADAVKTLALTLAAQAAADGKGTLQIHQKGGDFMGKVVRFTGPYQVEIAEYVERTPGPNQVLLATLYSGISSGTELSHYRGTNPFIHKVQNPATHLFEPVDDADWFPRLSGYEEVGQVIAVGPEVTGVVVGDVIYGTWQHHSTRILNGALAQRQKLPAGLDPICGIFSQIGAIVLNGILDAEINVGETVAVFGQGTPGLIAGQLARLSGATVIAVDLYESRLQLAAARAAGPRHQRRHGRPGRGNPAPDRRHGRRRLSGAIGVYPCLAASHPLRGNRWQGRGTGLLPGRSQRALPGRRVPSQPGAAHLLANRRHQPGLQPAVGITPGFIRRS